MSASMNRRNFARSIAAGTVVVPLDVGVVCGEAQTQQKETADTPPRAELDLLMDLVKQRYPVDELTDEELDAVRSRLSGKIARSQQLSEFALENSQEPAFVYPAFRAEGR